MYINRLLPLTVLLIVGSLQSVAQTQGDYIKSDYFANQIPKNPGVAPLGNFGNVPVNYFTGQPEISLPLMTLTSRELSLPISLNYDASGVKTDELSGQVGLKWSLNAASYVVRDLNGLPDEEPTKGYWTQAYATDYWNNANLNDWTGYSERNDYDSKPDEFIVNINGRSIKFVFDKNKQALTVPRQNVKITYTLLNNKIDKFEVTTEDGTKYIFGGTPTAIEQRKIESLTLRLRFLFDETREDIVGGASYFTRGLGIGEYFSNTFDKTEKVIEFYNSKWFIQSITSPANDQISFTYEKKADVKYALKPTVTRASPLLVTLSSYARTVIGDCKVPLCIGGERYTYDFVHPCSQSACPNPVINSRPLLAVRKFTWTEPGSAPPKASDAVFPGETVDPNAVPSSNIIAQTDDKKYFKPETYKADPGGVVANHLLVTESNIILKSIQSSVGHTIYFDVSVREDLPNAWKYDRIRLLNYSGETIKNIKLNYATLNAKEDTNDAFWITEALMMNTIGTLTQTGTQYYAYFAKAYAEALIPDAQLRKYVFEGLKDYNYKRVFLESIEDATATKKFPLYTFTYNGTTRELLKRRTTPLADVYGFYRNSGPTDFISIKQGKTANSILGYNPGASNTGNDKLCSILTRITYPTSGYTEFSYTQKLGPKIQKIADFDESGSIVNQREVEYISPISNYSPTFISYQEYRVKDTNDWMKYKISSSSPQNDLPNKASLEVHDKVIVYSGTKLDNMGWEELTFKVNGDANLALYASPPDTDASNNNLASITGKNDVYPFIRPEAHDHLEGYLALQRTFDKSDPDNPIRIIKNDYDLNLYDAPKFVQGFNGGSYQYTSGTKNTFWYGTVPEAVNRNRYGTYKINADWYPMTKTTETVYSQTDKAKAFVKVTEYLYDRYNLQLIGSTTYNLNAPQSKVITRTKYATHSDYFNSPNAASCSTRLNTCLTGCNSIVDATSKANCISSCNAQYGTSCVDTNSNPALAIEELKARNQILTPLEVQNITEENGQQKLISAVVYKYLKQGSPGFVKPQEIIGLKQTMDLSTYVTSKIDASGYFVKDDRARSLHNFNQYDAFGNLLQQTTSDGIVSTYQWGYLNSLVAGFTINPATSALTYLYDQKPLVGLNFSTDPNLRNSYYEYDKYWRFKLSKDHDGNIVNRYLYHYKDISDNEVDFTYSTYSNTATDNTIKFLAQGGGEAGTSFLWDFGNGTVRENASGSQLQTYTTTGNYTVTLATTHPDFPTASVTKVITILPQPSIQITSPITGTNRSVCGTGISTVTVSTTGGPYTYSWEHEYTATGSGIWAVVGTTPTITFTKTGVQGAVSTLRCKITDSNGNTRYSNYVTISYYCSGTPGPGDCPSGWTWNASAGRCDPPAGYCGDGCSWTGTSCACQ